MTHGPTRRKAIAFALTLGGAAVLAEAARPRRRDAARAKVPLETIFPAAFGDWRTDGMAQAFVQPPDEQGRIYGFYDQVLERAYRRTSGERVMLCVAYGSEQSPALQVHRPEVCYAAGGFQVHGLLRGELRLKDRVVHVTRLHAEKVGRSEPITYWTVLGDDVVDDSRSFRWRQLQMAVRGEIRDGMLVRVSSISRDAPAQYGLHARFCADLMQTMAPQYRDRVFGRPWSG